MLIFFDMLFVQARYRNKLEFYYKVYPLCSHFCYTIIYEMVKGLRYPLFSTIQTRGFELKFSCVQRKLEHSLPHVSRGLFTTIINFNNAMNNAMFS